MLKQVDARYRDDASDHDVSLTLEIETGPVNLRIAEAALSEVLGALLANAVKYTPDHGVIRLSATRADDADTVRISVSDSGTGIQEEARERIFEPFFRTSAARASPCPGVGLGLAFVKSVVESAGGSISVGESDLGGAEFAMNLAVVEPVEPGKKKC